MVVRGLAVPVALAGVVSCGAIACVHIPDSLRAEFREVGPGERSNFRPGAHGSARGRDLVGPMPTLAPAASSSAPAAEPAPAPSAPSVASPGASAASSSAPAAPADGGAK